MRRYGEIGKKEYRKCKKQQHMRVYEILEKSRDGFPDDEEQRSIKFKINQI
jgi:hypothetical protein